MNHLYVITQGLNDPDTLNRSLLAVAFEQWPGQVEVARQSRRLWDIRATGSLDGVAIWLRSTRKIELRRHGGQLSIWIACFMQHALADRLAAECQDEGTSYRFKPNVARMRTYRAWMRWLHRDQPLDWIDARVAWMLERAPKEILRVRPVRRS